MDSINNPQLMTDEQARRLGLYRPEKPKHYETQQRSGMTLNEYQNAAWPFLDENSRSPSYTLLGVGEEAGELQGKFAKAIRKGILNPDYSFSYDASQLEHDEFLDGVKKELGDVLNFVATVGKQYGLSLNVIALANLAKLEDRQRRGVLIGDGDNR